MNTPANKKLILSIDDDPIFRDVIKSDLRRIGMEYEFFEASDGKNGLRIAADLAGTPYGLALIICDWNMPNLSGIEFYQLAKLNLNLKDVPFLMITTVNTKVEILKAMKLGIKDYMIKPWSYEDFEVKVKKILNLP